MCSNLYSICNIIFRSAVKSGCGKSHSRAISSLAVNKSPEKIKILPLKNFTFNNCVKHIKHSAAALPEFKSHIDEHFSNQQLLNRPHKKRIYEPWTVPIEEGTFVSFAYATAAEYDLEGLKKALDTQKLYTTGKLSWPDPPDVLHALATYQVGTELREVYFFREGAIVFWNCSEAEAENVLAILKRFEIGTYNKEDIVAEREMMLYKYQSRGKKCQLEENWGFLLSDTSGDAISGALEKYTFSNAMIQSVKLGVWERSLARLADDVQAISKDMAAGEPLKVSRRAATQLSGQLYNLRHQINLESDLLDTPDFYWEHLELERLYGRTVGFFSIARRTQVLNKRLEHCVELIELLNEYISDKKHIRLDWLIIILILMAVTFESHYFIEKYIVY